MAEQRDKVDRLARDFIETAAALGDALLEQLQAKAPDSATAASKALESGAQLQMAMKFHPEHPAIVWELVFPDRAPLPLVTIPGKRPRGH